MPVLVAELVSEVQREGRRAHMMDTQKMLVAPIWIAFAR
jgi:hypothetical protein